MPETTENGTKVRYETHLNSIRRDLQKLREINDRLKMTAAALNESNHPASAEILHETNATINVALSHAREVFRSF